MQKYLIRFFIFALAALWAFNISANTVSINADGVMVIDGQKVFPIGFTVSPPPDGKTQIGRASCRERV